MHTEKTSIQNRYAGIFIPPPTEGYPQSTQYRVYVNGQPCPVYDTRVFFELNNQDRVVSFCYFDFNTPVRIVVESLRPVESVRIRPTNRFIHYQIMDNCIKLSLSDPAKLSIEINGDIDSNLHLFAGCPEESVPSSEDGDVLYYGPGMHYIDGDYGYLRLLSNQVLYLAPGAVLCARLVADNAENIKICGRGVLLGSSLLGRQPNYYRQYLGEPAETKRPRFAVFKNCRNIVVEGIFLNDTPAWSLVFDHCRDVIVRNIKQFGYVDNCDAIDIVSTQNVLIDDVFLRANDDCVVIKANGDDVYDVVVQNSIMWSDRAQALQIGHELVCGHIKDVVFRNIDVLEQRNRYVGHYAIGIYNGGYAEVSDVLFDDIRVENHFRLIGLIVDKGYYGRTEERGTIRGISFRNIDSLTTMDLHITGWDSDHGVSDISFENLTVRGKCIDPDIFHNLNVRNLSFMTSGSLSKHIDTFVKPDTKYQTLDITAACNRSRIDEQAGDGLGWLDLGPTLDMRELEGGLHIFGGIPFHIPDKHSGAIILRSSQYLVNQPYWSYPISINQPVNYLFILQGTAFTDNRVDKVPPEVWIGGAGKLRFNQSNTGTPLWYYRIRYADNGAEIRVPVKAGWNVEDWEIWAPGGWVVRLFGKKFYIQQWENPYPERTIAYIKVESALQPEVPIVLGITMGVSSLT